ncbi:PTS lactose/cellobiose transporter subunit IIA [Domibacillus sp. A3M-37]|uniref:PTS lactose/cellobiose transporter subunit IIA n=1 Tax=Domibacillus sp. A3M-37 TaxID=2962037 RepID=UPI0020B69AA4|nr:PTS lactose/cellobiose transporter subunit IIA [Domibacillus sp. A3M-37]MCP3763713.1 PTS lactose/cellobiose transporter subunit IIA [Domibacillus sp. A3M-37]
MGLIVNAGNGRSKAMESIILAKEGKYLDARKKLEEAAEDLGKAHHLQTSLIQQEAGGEKKEVTLLMIHAQDHLMNAMTVKDLAAEFVDLYEKQQIIVAQ